MEKVSDIIAEFLKKNNMRNIFAITGGASIHLIHSISKKKGMRCIYNHHEQAGAMGADGLSRSSSSPSCAIATSGPGATNLITGIGCSWFDSVPVIYITGQVTTFRLKKELKIRQLGFQETEIVSIVKSITKYAKQILRPEEILYELEKSLYIAKEGRQGPVLIDVPDDIQRMYVDKKDLKKFTPKKKREKKILGISKIENLLLKSKRPTIIFGAGANKVGNYDLIKKFVNIVKIPFLTTWGAKSLISNNKLNFGTFGTHGTRHGNFCVQNSDLLIIIGSRLSTRETGSPLSNFARKAKLVMIDVDINEIKKFKNLNRKIDFFINCDSNIFFRRFLKDNKIKKNFERISWIQQNIDWKKTFRRKLDLNSKKIDPYNFVRIFNKFSKNNSDLFIDTGSCLAWFMQDYICKTGQRIFHDLNFTAMGWSLPASIGASLENKKRNIISIVGDGSFMVNSQELPLVKKYCKNLKIFIINNKGYAMVKQTEDEWLKSLHFGTSDKDLKFSNFKKLAESSELKYSLLKSTKDLMKLREILSSNGNHLCEISIPTNKQVIPQVKFGHPLEDAHPLLDRKLMKENMLIDLLDV